MRLGIDLGTTRTVVAVVDRGNYPVVGFETCEGDFQEWYPYLIGVNADTEVYGLDAEAYRHDPGWTFLRSLKRLLAESSPESTVRLGGRDCSVLGLLTKYLTALRNDLVKRSNLDLGRKEPLEAWVSVPANANNNQRFLTLEGFRQAGFEVKGVLNEPSAAGIEYVHRFGAKRGAGRKDSLAVYDLGGGTFDVSIIGVSDEMTFHVLTTEGISRLGGNDFDEVLLDLALERAGMGEALPDRARFDLLEECCQRKEGLHPNTRKTAVDLGVAIPGADEVVVPVADYYRRLEPMVDRTLRALDTAFIRLGEGEAEKVGAVYMVGGACELPLVSRRVREIHGRRVRRSPYPFAATAVGLAVAADREHEISIQERFTRHFGVWREAEEGRRIVFDSIFPKDTALPGPGDPPLVLTRKYAPAHNVAHLRYLECSRVTEDDQPAGDINPWDDIMFPLDPVLKRKKRLDRVPVEHFPGVQDQVVEEHYACDARGVINVTIQNRSAGYRRRYKLRSHLSWEE